MKLKPEHEHNWSPYSKSGVYLLLKDGEVIFVDESDDVLASVVWAKKHFPEFGAFSWVPCRSKEERHWLAQELFELYRPLS